MSMEHANKAGRYRAPAAEATTDERVSSLWSGTENRQLTPRAALIAALLLGGLHSPLHADENAEEAEQSGLLDAFDVRGNIGIDATVFTATPVHSATQQTNLSVSGEVELYRSFGDGDNSILITPFLRIDQHDSERTHFDFRELLYQHTFGDWEIQAGLGKVFWGVAESSNPVDVINQTDQVENLTTNEKLGQPMIQASWAGETSEFELFILPGFRERTYPGENGRPRLPLAVDPDAAEFESDDEARHIGAAFRYIYLFDEWDLGFSYFNGTARDPLLRPDASGESLVPFYYLVSQVGLDVQATLESWLLKLEVVHQSGDEIENHVRAVSGFEYSFYSVGESDTDIGIVMEYLYDERGDTATQPLQNDVLAGIRIALNDEQSTEALIGILADLDGDGMTFSAEASRRIGDNYKLTLEATTWFDSDPEGQQAAIDREDNINVRFARFF